MKKMKQPKIKSGLEFYGWATFNWGLCHQRVFRTRKEAQAFCADNVPNGWDNVKDYHKVVKVKCVVI